MDPIRIVVALVIFGCVSADNRMQLVSLEHYMSRNGDCPGRTISRLLKSDIDMCASECDKLPNCRAFLYVPDWSGLDDSPYCELKYATCNALTHGAARHYHFYDKFVNFIHYTRRYGRCLGNTIKVMRDTGLMRCQAECDRLPHCTGFTFSLGRHDIRRLPQCELKFKSCTRPVFTSSREIQTYDKIENATIPLPEEPETTPIQSTLVPESDNSTDIDDDNDNTTVTDDGAELSGNLTEITTLPPSSTTPTITDLPTTQQLRIHYQYFLRPGDCPGSNINQQPLVFEQRGECHYACDENPDCVAYHLILPTRESDNTTKCYLKWDTCEETSAFSISRLQFYDRIEVEPGYIMKYGKCSDFGASEQFYTVENVADCKEHCDSWERCAGFDYRQVVAWMGKKSACHLRSSPCKILVANPRANYDRSYEQIRKVDTGRLVTSENDDVTAFIITGVALTLAALVLAAVYVIRVRRKLVNPHQRFDQVNMPTYENQIAGQSPGPSPAPAPRT